MLDFLIVGAGLYGAVVANITKQHGKSVLVIDRRANIAGNIFTKNISSINVHMYGPHIFHTNNHNVWNYISQFAKFNHYKHMPIANYKGELYPLPFNMNTFNAMWGITNPSDAHAKIKKQADIGNREITNLEQQAISIVGTELYEKLIKGYTEKQWGRHCNELPASIIKRLPVRFTFDNNYYDSIYQGIPIGGYTNMVKRMLSR